MSDTYKTDIEKPSLIKYIQTINPDLDWSSFATYLSKPKEKRTSEEASNLYDTGILPELRKIFMSHFQSIKAVTGKRFEKIVEQAMIELDIPFSRQVFVSNNIISTRKSNLDNSYIVDFTIPQAVKGCPISDFIIISCKTTIRDRGHQDDIMKQRCKLFIPLTYDKTKINDYKYVVIQRNDSDPTTELLSIKENLWNRLKLAF